MQSDLRTLEFQNKGFVTLKCPIAGCTHKRRFTETTQTANDAVATKRRRDEFLRQQHAAGSHK